MPRFVYYRRIFSPVKKRPSHVFAVSESCRELSEQILVLSVNLKIWKLVIPTFNQRLSFLAVW